MHEFMNDNCEKCNKFSHCNNNDLICISKYRTKEREVEDWKCYECAKELERKGNKGKGNNV